MAHQQKHLQSSPQVDSLCPGLRLAGVFTIISGLFTGMPTGANKRSVCAEHARSDGASETGSESRSHNSSTWSIVDDS